MAVDPRRSAKLRAALLGAGSVALGVCLLAVMALARSGDWRLASFFALPWALFAVFLLAPRRPPGF